MAGHVLPASSLGLDRERLSIKPIVLEFCKGILRTGVDRVRWEERYIAAAKRVLTVASDDYILVVHVCRSTTLLYPRLHRAMATTSWGPGGLLTHSALPKACRTSTLALEAYSLALRSFPGEIPSEVSTIYGNQRGFLHFCLHYLCLSPSPGPPLPGPLR